MPKFGGASALPSTHLSMSLPCDCVANKNNWMVRTPGNKKFVSYLQGTINLQANAQ